MAHANSTTEELLAEIEFWIGMYGKALDALDECAGDDEEGWDRQRHAEEASARLHAEHQARDKSGSLTMEHENERLRIELAIAQGTIRGLEDWIRGRRIRFRSAKPYTPVWIDLYDEESKRLSEKSTER